MDCMMGGMLPGCAVLKRGPNSELEHCEALLQAPAASAVVLEFTALDTELEFDVLTAYDGPTADSPLLWSGSGNTIPAKLVSTGDAVLLVWTSDRSFSKSGWRLKYYTNSVCPMPAFLPSHETGELAPKRDMPETTNIAIP